MQRLIKTRLSSNGCAELISITVFFFFFLPCCVYTRYSLSFLLCVCVCVFFLFCFVFAAVRTNTDLWAALIRDHLPIVNIRSVKNVFLKSPLDNTETDLSDLQPARYTRLRGNLLWNFSADSAATLIYRTLLTIFISSGWNLGEFTKGGCGQNISNLYTSGYVKLRKYKNSTYDR